MSLALSWLVCLTNACASRRVEEPRAEVPDADSPARPSVLDLGAGTATKPEVATDLFALLGVQPNHGPFTGGQLAILRGNGFTPGARVWFGTQEIAASSLQPVDSKRLQLTLPEGQPGPVDVITQNGDDTASRRTLVGGYTFDSFFVTPAVGPTAGGVEIHVKGRGTHWDNTTRVFVDLKPCTSARALGPDELVCTSPAGTLGSKPVRVETADAVAVDVADAYAYSDSLNNFRGGLSGNALSGQLEVLIFDRNTGKPLAGAVVVGGAEGAAQTADSGGRVLLKVPPTNRGQTLTVAAHCYQPQTFAEVPVETATVYLDPVLSPACGSPANTRLTGGASIYTESVEGELLWPNVREFQVGGWNGVPVPKNADEQLAAYVFPLSSDASAPFVLPAAYEAVTPLDSTNAGYRFSLRSFPDTVTLYALAGVENRKVTPPFFIPYVMGLTRGVKIDPGVTKAEVFLQMDIPLDQTLGLQVFGPDLIARGPNRLAASVAVGLADQGFIVLPGAQKQTLYPAPDPLRIVGLPPLIGKLTGTTYVAGGAATTGATGGVPRSRSARLETRLSGQVVTLNQFVQIPKLTQPLENVSWDGRVLSLDWASGGVPVDLVVIDISSAGGLVNWGVILPRGIKSVELPDLRNLPGELGLSPGPITLKISSAMITNFNYGALTYGDLSRRSWDAYAEDVVQGRLSP